MFSRLVIITASRNVAGKPSRGSDRRCDSRFPSVVFSRWLSSNLPQQWLRATHAPTMPAHSTNRGCFSGVPTSISLVGRLDLRFKGQPWWLVKHWLNHREKRLREASDEQSPPIGRCWKIFANASSKHDFRRLRRRWPAA